MTSTPRATHGLRAQPLGGPTVILEVAGLRLLTDPTFDAPGDYPRGAYSLTKTVGPAFSPGEIGLVDVVLLSHDQHPDNLDTSGRAFLARVTTVLTTISGAQRLGGTARPLPRWTYVDMPLADGGSLRITGVPAQHGPDGTDHLTGEVTGFVLSSRDLPTVYISGDNASLDVVRAIAERVGSVDIAILFAGAARSPLLGAADLTLSGALAAEAALILGAARVLAIHVDSWAHSSEGLADVIRAFDAVGIADRLVLAGRGAPIVL